MKSSKAIALTFIMQASLFLSSCTLGPDFLRPSTPIIETDQYLNDTQDKASVDKTISRWWERINDPLLSTYIDKLLSENLDLKAAKERVLQSKEGILIARGGLFPSLGASGDGSRSFTPGTAPLDRRYTTALNGELTTSWEADLFGQTRRTAEAAEYNYRASIFDKQALTHSLIAQLLNRRIAVAVNKRRLNLAKKNTQNRKNLHALIKQRYNLGASGVNLADVYLAEENYTSVQADQYRFERSLAEENYALDVLLGQKPGTTDPYASKFPLLPDPIDIPICLPIDLLDRRPDLKASELRLAAATAEIGIAMADLYPGLSLGGSIGFTGNTTNNLFSATQLAGSLLGSITARLFEGGALRANIRLQESEARELAHSYTGTILNAMQDVETALKAETELAKELQSTKRSVKALRTAENISKDRYDKGIESLQNFLDTQQRRYNTEQSLLGIQQERWNARIALYLALGGDWLDKTTNIKTCSQSKDNAP